VHVEPPEVGQLAGRVDLGLVAGLGLAEHGGGVHPVAPRSGQQVRGAQQDRGALVVGQRAPGRPGPQRRLDRGLGVLGGGVRARPQDVGVVVRGDDVEPGAAGHVLAAVHGDGELVLLTAHLGQRGLQARPLG
jgi:hypothetical protein